MTNRLAKICPLLPFALILLLGTFPAFAQTAEAEEHTETGIKYLHLYDTEDEKAVFRAVHKGMATPVAVNTFELYGEDVSIALCNITEKTIKEMDFSYAVFDENDKELFSISESLSHEISPYAACTFSIGNPVKVSGWTETIRNKTIRIIFADGSEAALSDDEGGRRQYGIKLSGLYLRTEAKPRFQMMTYFPPWKIPSAFAFAKMRMWRSGGNISRRRADIS